MSGRLANSGYIYAGIKGAQDRRGAYLLRSRLRQGAHVLGLLQLDLHLELVLLRLDGSGVLGLGSGSGMLYAGGMERCGDGRSDDLLQSTASFWSQKHQARWTEESITFPAATG